MDTKDWNSHNKLAHEFFEEVGDMLLGKIHGLEDIAIKYERLGLPEYMSKALTMMAVKIFYKVFEKQRYIVGVAGAPCTRFLKKEVRKKYEQLNDIQVFGYTAEEQDRVDRFIDANNDVNLWSILIDKRLTKQDCLSILSRAGIELPAMYKLGYQNNNCIGCVKGGLGYWNKIKIDFPDHFERMAQMEKTIGAKILKKSGERIWLTDLPPDAGDYPTEQSIECGIFCHMAEAEIGNL